MAKAWDRNGNVLLCSSFTKTVSPGLRVGWIAPGKLFNEVAMLKFINSVATPELPQAAIAEFMANGGYDHHLRKLRAGFARQVQQTTQAIAEFFPNGHQDHASRRRLRALGGAAAESRFARAVPPRARSAHQHRARADVHHHQALSQLHPHRLRTSVECEDRRWR